MAGWHHWLDGRESEWTPGVGDGQGGLACCDSWGRKELDRTEWLNWTELTYYNIRLKTFFFSGMLLKKTELRIVVSTTNHDLFSHLVTRIHSTAIRYHWLNGNEFEQALILVKDWEDGCAVVHGVAKTQTRLSNWIATCFMLDTNIQIKHIHLQVIYVN